MSASFTTFLKNSTRALEPKRRFIPAPGETLLNLGFMLFVETIPRVCTSPEVIAAIIKKRVGRAKTLPKFFKEEVVTSIIEPLLTGI